MDTYFLPTDPSIASRSMTSFRMIGRTRRPPHSMTCSSPEKAPRHEAAVVFDRR